MLNFKSNREELNKILLSQHLKSSEGYILAADISYLQQQDTDVLRLIEKCKIHEGQDSNKFEIINDNFWGKNS